MFELVSRLRERGLLRLAIRTGLNGTGRLKPRHFLILVHPVLVSVLVTLIWYELRIHGFFVSQFDAEITTNANIPVLGMVYGFVAVVLLSRVLDDDIKIHQCVAAGEYEEMRKELKKRIHPLLHIFIGILSIDLIANMATLPYDSVWSGVKDVGGTTFYLALYWKIAFVLDNPLAAPWIRDVIPLEWQERLRRDETKE